MLIRQLRRAAMVAALSAVAVSAGAQNPVPPQDPPEHDMSKMNMDMDMAEL